MDKDNCFYIGTILKAHGVSGELVLKVEIDFFDLLIDEMESVFVEIDEQLIPFFISDIDYLNEDTAIILFDDLSDEKKAKEFIGCKLYLPNDLMPEETSMISDLNHIKGYHVTDTNLGDIGIVSDILQYSFNYVIQVMQGSREILIPASEEIIDEINEENKTVRVTTPDGLIDIYTK